MLFPVPPPAAAAICGAGLPTVATAGCVVPCVWAEPRLSAGKSRLPLVWPVCREMLIGGGGRRVVAPPVPAWAPVPLMREAVALCPGVRLAT